MRSRDWRSAAERRWALWPPWRNGTRIWCWCSCAQRWRRRELDRKRQYKEQLHAEMAQQVEEQAVRAASATLQESSVRDTMRVQAQAADSMDQRQQQMRRAYAHQTMLENRQLMEAKLERQRQRKAGEIEADTHNLGVHAERWGRSTLR